GRRGRGSRRRFGGNPWRTRGRGGGRTARLRAPAGTSPGSACRARSGPAPASDARVPREDCCRSRTLRLLTVLVTVLRGGRRRARGITAKRGRQAPRRQRRPRQRPVL